MTASVIPIPITITIRSAYPDDELSLARLAILDSAPHPPPAPLLLAEIDGQLRAALSLDDGSTIADPFFASTDILTLLRTHAASRTATVGRARTRRLRFAIS
ncbi:MAG: hypothetical protein ACR2OB_15020 [Solirubrobacteraceae bacterium]